MSVFPETLALDSLKLIRRRPTFENAVLMFQIVDKDRAYFEEWLGWASEIKSPEDAYNWLMKNEAENNCMYFIFNGVALIGSVGFVTVNEKTKTLEIGYWLIKEATGQGIIRRAIRMLEPMAFENGWEVIRIGCDVLNGKSRRVPEKLGYIFEGTLRCQEPYPDGRRYDNSFYSKLKSEWNVL